ncbi:hypothetical protein TEA_014715 [Camellia sinensis var. sinensis]|uniref:S-formylglutathione hydrolase n=1 Tax=Camellia sinensis var. sinensis TaxID=542762 RepID=A0A4S4ECF9_CAMSN|nr:hypothetical protein TEA_014715 [Camellia sinensis var. sinensis]
MDELVFWPKSFISASAKGVSVSASAWDMGALAREGVFSQCCISANSVIGAGGVLVRRGNGGTGDKMCGSSAVLREMWKQAWETNEGICWGEDDKFLQDQLMPHKFEEACRKANVPLLMRMQPGYDHSYYFIATFVEDHIRHHAQALNL